MPSIDLVGVSFAHSDSVPLITDLDLELRAGWTGLVGPNGIGKTTLLGLIAGRITPDAGRIGSHPAALSLCECAQSTHDWAVDIEAFAHDTERIACRLRGRLKLDADELLRWESLSPGERKRWQIGAAMSRRPDVLLLDEPTNHLDSHARDLLFDAIADFRGIGIVVSHDRTLLNRLCDRIVRFSHGRISPYRGGYDVARATWEDEQQQAHNSHQRIRREQKKLEARLTERRSQQNHAVARTRTSKRMKNPRDSAARGTFKAARRRSAINALGREIGIVKHGIERLEKQASGYAFEKDLGRSLFVDFTPAKRSTLFALEEGTVLAGDRWLFECPSLQIGRSDRIRLHGENGTGKTTLIDRLRSNSTLPRDRCLYLPQELGVERRRAMLDEARALDAETRGRLMHLVAALGVDPEALLESQSVSPGEARKLALATGLARQVWALIIDEPTNHLDLPSIERLENCLAEYPGALLLVSHDDAFASRLTETRWEIRDGLLTSTREPDAAGDSRGG